jgi:hypothetical protein
VESILDVKEWFAELDRLGTEPLTADGRSQPQPPHRRSSLLAEAPTRRYDANELRRRWERLGAGARGLPADLDWVRGDR